MSSSSLLRPASHNPTIYITGLQPSVTIPDLAEKFGTIGRIKTDKKTGDPKIYVYNDKATNVPKGDGTVTFEDPNAASAAVDWFNGTEFMGAKITVQLAEEKAYPSQNRGSGSAHTSRGSYGDSRTSSYNSRDRYAAEPEPYSDYDRGYNERSSQGSSAAPSRGAPPAAAAAAGNRSGEWDCPSCNNMNFAKRTECFKCHTPRPASAEPAQDSYRPQALPNFANPGDWSCKGCGNINWARRNTCNRCNTPKPTAVVEKRTGRGGGYNEREDVYDKPESSRSSRDYRSSDRSYRHDSSHEQTSRSGNYPDADYGYGSASRDRSAPYPSHNDSYNSRGSSYRQDSGSRRDRSRSPRRY